MRELRAARVAEQEYQASGLQARQQRQLIEIVDQRMDQQRFFAGDHAGVGPVAVGDRRGDDQPTVAVGLLDQLFGKILTVAAHAVER